MEINVNIGVCQKNTIFECSNEILKYSQCVELSYGQNDHNSENVSEFTMYTSFIVLNGVLRCNSILIEWLNFSC